MANGDTLSSTTALFFSEPDTSTCQECGTTDDSNRHILWTTADGKAVWNCRACQTRQEAVDEAEATKAQAEIAAMAARDEWEQA